MNPEREVLECDALIVGAGPAGLGAAIRLRQLAAESGRDLSVYVLEKGAEVGAHILAGAVLEPRALRELLPDDWRNAPMDAAADDDQFWFLTEKRKWKLPTPPQMHNAGNRVASLGRVVRWLAEKAEAAGADIFPGFPAAEAVFDSDGRMTGVVTPDQGVGKDETPGPNFAPGVELRAKMTILAEGCRGSVSENIIRKFNLRDGKSPQTYAIGLKELWEVPEAQARPGLVLHTVGWPLDSKTYGGSFMYHRGGGKIAVGFAVGLDYPNPHLSPHDEFQRFKTHPAIAPMLRGGRRVAYGARALNEGGWQAVPQLDFPGGVLAGCGAGFLNVPKIKGAHTALKSGMLAAEEVFAALSGIVDGGGGGGQKIGEATGGTNLTARVNDSWIADELRRARNIRPGFRRGLWFGMAHAALDSYVFRGRAPWTLRHEPDHLKLRGKSEAKPISYPKPDGVLTFDRLTNLAHSGVFHEENQPAHLKLTDPARAVSVNLREYDSPESRYCPAGVYEIVERDGASALQINAQNCLHCKTCDIKDPTQNIVWTTPPSGGPNYGEM